VRAALTGGADGVEVDARLTADQQLVCSHDPHVARIGATPLAIESSTAAELRRSPSGPPLALLDELLRTAAVHGRRRIVVEAKACAAAHDLAEGLAAVLAPFAASLELVVSSFDAALLRAIRSALAELPVDTALLGDTFTPAVDVVRQAVVDGHDQVHLNQYSLLRAPGVAATARSLGLEVTCWTVNRARHVQRLATLGVDGLITDKPVAVRTMLRKHDSAAVAGW
jgi:glycerophosphoryl diester phosphodiesterase